MLRSLRRSQGPWGGPKVPEVIPRPLGRSQGPWGGPKGPWGDPKATGAKVPRDVPRSLGRSQGAWGGPKVPGEVPRSLVSEQLTSSKQLNISHPALASFSRSLPHSHSQPKQKLDANWTQTGQFFYFQFKRFASMYFLITRSFYINPRLFNNIPDPSSNSLGRLRSFLKHFKVT